MSIHKQRTVGGHPQDVGIDDADVDKPPEEVLLQLLTRTPHPLVSGQVIESPSMCWL